MINFTYSNNKKGINYLSCTKPTAFSNLTFAVLYFVFKFSKEKYLAPFQNGRHTFP
ncbi:hypothetical protein SAMN05660909_04858 [Chitinophaga terrae (ex Kim and Jung 2007)]|uniref:Uncharacterized protein n=1 Tax=Chitinophaga terrae (ex Kim and Jung 2007) TaxID=408074 RepID=A0A1H4G1D5_9BACT|nr:hypothetical protein [Chitinophaga terrae (ex Kim and Jung 2007)]MDQ0108805.1 hypothetical protein [Chitinophaga terrae (ex Kim and Jung 2007)]GEP93024.1 hypothetical protein CTE07_46690 [Chitinophaga terrae (ex Kim and Jung 2007)]SEB03403.1 hypothetical protein SAMN05660909_04858 [Chitinophaga terrae (ex Kim and Jung 2007)]